MVQRTQNETLENLLEQLEQLQLQETVILDSIRQELRDGETIPQRQIGDRVTSPTANQPFANQSFPIEDTVFIKSKVKLPKSERDKGRTTTQVEDKIDVIIGWTDSG